MSSILSHPYSENSQSMEGGICRVIQGHPIKKFIKTSELQRFGNEALVQVELLDKPEIMPVVLFSLLELLTDKVIIEVPQAPPSRVGIA